MGSVIRCFCKFCRHSANFTIRPSIFKTYTCPCDNKIFLVPSPTTVFTTCLTSV